MKSISILLMHGANMMIQSQILIPNPESLKYFLQESPASIKNPGCLTLQSIDTDVKESV